MKLLTIPSRHISAGTGALILMLAGCANRGADDRVNADLNRTDAGRPGYAVVAWRQVDYARLSGNVVVMTSGEEPVFVQQAASYHVPVEDRGTSAATSKILLEQLTAIEKRLSDNVPDSHAGQHTETSSLLPPASSANHDVNVPAAPESGPAAAGMTATTPPAAQTLLPETSK